MATTPTGATHEVPLDDIFFSTTDRRGLILQANEVFVRLARQSAEELLGAPHNIIRHPDMPGGAFRIIWSTIQAGEPVAAYVVNLAADGSAYWTFATVVPIDHGYLSVRTRPLCTDTLTDIGAVYREVRAKELAARAKGASTTGAAVVGNELLLAALAERGYASYEAFIHDALCAEVEARLEARGPLPARTDASRLLQTVLDGVEDIEIRVRDLFTQLGGFHDASRDLTRRCVTAGEAIERMTSVLSRIGEIVEGATEREPFLARAIEPLHERSTSVAETVGSLARLANNLTESRTSLRFSVGLAILQVEMMARFVVALMDEAEDSISSAAGVGVLGEAMTAGLAAMERDLTADHLRAEELRNTLMDSGSRIRVMQMTVGRWRELVQSSALAPQLTDQLATLDDAMDRAQTAIDALPPALDEFSRASVSFHMGPTNAHLARVRSLLDGIARAG